MLNVYFSPAYVRSAYGFDTTRKAKWIADDLASCPIPGLELVEPDPLTGTRVARVHDPAYVRAVETGEPRELAQSQGFPWDPGIWPMVLASNGGIVAAALSALDRGVAGSLSSGLHHARYASGAGFCTFNGLVIAAREALMAGARAVLILDFDAHCGGGTASLIADEPRISQIDVSVNRYDSYAVTEQATLDIVTSATEYPASIEAALERASTRVREFDLCLYNAGMDPYEGCSTGGLDGVTQAILADRERLVFDWCARQRMPVAFVLAGGYVGDRLDEAGLVALHRLTLSAAAAHG